MPLMSSAYLAAVITSVVTAAGALIAGKTWNGRGIIAPKWLPLATGTAGVAAGIAAAGLGWVPSVVVSVTALTALTVISTVTDLTSVRMPKEAAWAAAATGIGCAAFGHLPIMMWVVYAASVIAVYIAPFVAHLFWNGIGMGDVRFIGAAGILMNWWAGPVSAAAALVIACVLQLLLRAALKARPTLRERMPRDEEMRSAVPFGPALGLGIIAITGASLLGLVL